jgi:enediyne biosynthesis protein E4
MNRASAAGSFLGLDLRRPLGGKPSATRFLPFPARGVAADPAIGATATIQLPDGHKQIQSVDGGNGFAGTSAPQLLFGLGAHPPSSIPATITWRDGNGHVHRTTLRLTPGWHTILLEQR